MKRIPSYFVIALCGLLLVGMGVMTLAVSGQDGSGVAVEIVSPTPTSTPTLTPTVEPPAPVESLAQPPVVQPAVQPIQQPISPAVEVPSVQPTLDLPAIAPTLDVPLPTVEPTLTLPVESQPVQPTLGTIESLPAVEVSSIPATAVVETLLPATLTVEALPAEAVPSAAIETVSVIVLPDMPTVTSMPLVETPITAKGEGVPVGAQNQARGLENSPVILTVTPTVAADVPLLSQLPPLPAEVAATVTLDPAWLMPVATSIPPTILPTVDSSMLTTAPVVDTSALTADPTVDAGILTPQMTTEMTLAAMGTVVPAETLAQSQIAGVVTYPMLEDFSGIMLRLTLPDGTTHQTVTDAAGQFVFDNVPPGAYTLEAVAAGYLASRIEFVVEEGQTTTLPPAVLRVGDTNQDNVIDLADAALIAGNFNSPASVVEADLNHDKWIDVRDLALIGAQYGMTGPSAWQ